MSLEKKPYKDYTLDEEKDKGRDRVLRIRLNKSEWDTLVKAMRVMQQPKPSTAVKQLVEIALNVLHRDSTGQIMRICLNNRRRNQRSGAAFDDRI